MKKSKKDIIVDKKYIVEPSLNEVIEFENDDNVELLMDVPNKK